MPSDTPSTVPNVAALTAPSSRRVEILTTLLERYHDLTDPQQTRAEPGESVGLPLMPATYTPTVRELERLIRQLRDDRRGAIVKWEHNGERYEASPRRLWWHLNAWYIDVQHVLHTPKLTQPRNKRKQLTRAPIDQDDRRLPQVRVLRNAEARYPIALKAIEQLAETWGLKHEPMLPNELRDAAA